MSTVVTMTFSRARRVAEKLREPLRAVTSPGRQGGRRTLTTSSVLGQAQEEDTQQRPPWQEQASLYVHVSLLININTLRVIYGINASMISNVLNS